MSELNNPGCVLVGANTGVPDCAFIPDKFVGAILVPKNLIILDADIPTIITKLQALVLEAAKDRVYPVFRFEEITDNSGEETIAELGYGSKQIVKDGKYDFTFRIVQGGMCLQNNLRTFNGAGRKVLFIDGNNVIYGTKVPTGVAGLSMDFFYAKPFKINDGTNATMFNVRFALSKPSEFNENVAFIKADVDVEESVKGIIDLDLSILANVAGKITIGVKTACDKIDLFETFKTELASGSLWKVTKAGVAVAVTSVVASVTLPGFAVSFVGTGVHKITLAAPATLAIALIGGAPDNGFEADILTATMV